MDLYYPNQALYCRASEGKKEYFYPDGTFKTVETYYEGKLDGETLLFWPNGKRKRLCSFKKGVRHGIDQMWSDEGVLIDEGRYEMGKAVGVHRRFSKQGKLLEDIEYLDDSRFNLRSWDEMGILRVEAIWIETQYKEKSWDRFQNIWIEKEGFWNGKKLVYV